MDNLKQGIDKMVEETKNPIENLGRKEYSNFHPTWEHGPLKGEDRTLTGLDRLYALHQFLRKNQHFHPTSVIKDDIKGFPEGNIPSTLVFSDKKYEIGKDGWGDKWEKNDNGDWVHVAFGNQFWDDVVNMLDKENPIIDEK